MLGRIQPLPDRPTSVNADPRDLRSGMIGFWIIVGVVMVVIATQGWVRWILSPTEFAPAPILGPDTMPMPQLVALRVLEAISVVVFVAGTWTFLIRPLVRHRQLGLDGRLFIGCCVTATTDCMLNLFSYIFAWNAHSLNMGSWSKFLPLHSPSSSSRYAEGLAWGIPMYIYTLICVAVLGCWVVQKLRARFPGITNFRALVVFWFVYFVMDAVGEIVIIRATQAYSFSRTNASLTLWPGSLYQFPLYEAFCTACFAVLFTSMRLSAIDSPDGISWVERGCERLRPKWQPTARLFAVIGFSCFLLLVCYQVWYNLLGNTGDSFAPLPSYMLPG